MRARPLNSRKKGCTQVVVAQTFEYSWMTKSACTYTAGRVTGTVKVNKHVH